MPAALSTRALPVIPAAAMAPPTHRSALSSTLAVLLLVLTPVAIVVYCVGPGDTHFDGITPLADINAKSLAGMAIIGVGMMLASAGGLGGGFIVVPVLILLMDFEVKFATAASNLIVLSGAIANTIVGLQKRHPLGELVDRPLVDPDLMFGMIPPVVGGAVVGAILSKLLPSYIISLSFLVVLALGAVKTVHKGMQIHSKEVAAIEAEARAASMECSAVASPKSTSTPFALAQSPFSKNVEIAIEEYPTMRSHASDQCHEESSEETAEEKRAALAKILEEESRFSWFKHGIVAMCYQGVLLMTVVQVASRCGSWAYWIFLLGEIPWSIAFSLFFMRYTTKKHARKIAVGYCFAPGDVQWNRKNVMWFPIICSLAGVVAGLFGVGGGIVVGPLMIEIGVIPQVSAATAALMILYGSAAAVTKFAVFEMIKWDWALTISAMTFVVTLLSQYFIGNYIRRTRRESIVVFCIGISVSIGGVFMAYQAIRSTVDTAGKPFHVDFCR